MKDDLRFICHLVNQSLGISQYTYPMYQNAPRPEATAFAAARLFKTTSPQRDSTSMAIGDDGSDVMRTYASRILTFDVLFVGEDENVNAFDSCFTRQDIINRCNSYGYGYLTKEPIDLENTSLETDWEFRNGIRLTFHRVRITDVPLGVSEYSYEPAHDIDGWDDTYIEDVDGSGTVSVGSDIHEVDINTNE